MTDILIIEDDPEMGQIIKDFMIKEGFSARLCPTAEEALELLEGESFGIVLLDVMLPKMSGYETGADDYIDKPFSIKVLTAKVRALMKRSGGGEQSGKLSGCGIELDTSSRIVTRDGAELKLNAKEFELLRYLMEHSGEAVSKDELFNAVWGCDCFTEPSTVSVHIRWLREKIERDPNSPEVIRTVWKVGYRFGEQK